MPKLFLKEASKLHKMNDIVELREHLLSYPHCEERVPFGDQFPVYKVGGKIFTLLIPDEYPARMNLKCEPEYAIELRATYKSIIPGYHMNKKHWNTILLDDTIPDEFIQTLIRHSYELVIAGMPKKLQESLKQ